MNYLPIDRVLGYMYPLGRILGTSEHISPPRWGLKQVVETSMIIFCNQFLGTVVYKTGSRRSVLSPSRVRQAEWACLMAAAGPTQGWKENTRHDLAM